MKATGIVRRVDELGRVCLPKELRMTRNIKEGDPLEIFVDGNMICLSPIPEERCRLCGSAEHLSEIGSNYICHDCRCAVVDSFSESN